MPIDLSAELRAVLQPVLEKHLASIVETIREELRVARQDPERLVGSREAARILGLSPEALRKASERGTIPRRKVGRLATMSGNCLLLGSRGQRYRIHTGRRGPSRRTLT